MPQRLAIITTHPIQYNAPLFARLAQEADIQLKVFYTWGQSQEQIYDPGFGQSRRWDIPLLAGYEHTFVPNTASQPGSHHFWGIQNPDLIAQINAFQPDALLVYGWSFYSHLKTMRYFKGKIPVWFRGDSHLLDESTAFSWKKLLRRTLLRWVYRYVDTAFYVGQANRAYYLKHGLKQTQLQFAPHAIDHQRFESDGHTQEKLALKQRLKLGIPQDAQVFLFVGKLEAKKNPAQLIRAFQASSSASCFLLLVGEGPDKAHLQALAAEHPRIFFLGFQNQTAMPIIYRLGDVIVLPSQGPGETWGLAINEAFACSRPAIVSDKVGCGSDLIQPGQTGWVYDASQEQALQHCLQLACTQGKSKLQAMGKQAHTLIQAWHYDAIASAIKIRLYALK